LLRQLSQQPGQHLVLVSYGPGQSPQSDWIANPADWNHAHVLFARALDSECDLALLRQFPDRHAWSLYVDDGARRIEFHPLETKPSP
jgi:hypothetical protein